MNQLQRDFLRLKETVEVLAGERGAPDRSAVRRGDLRIPALRSKPISAAPTEDDFNALRADIEALREVLIRMQKRGN